MACPGTWNQRLRPAVSWWHIFFSLTPISWKESRREPRTSAPEAVPLAAVRGSGAAGARADGYSLGVSDVREDEAGGEAVRRKGGRPLWPGWDVENCRWFLDFRHFWGTDHFSGVEQKLLLFGQPTREVSKGETGEPITMSGSTSLGRGGKWCHPVP